MREGAATTHTRAPAGRPEPGRAGRSDRHGTLGLVQALVTAGAGFLLAVLWFDLMFDVQVRPYGSAPMPESVVASIAGYYRRVTTDAGAMSRLIALFMLVTV